MVIELKLFLEWEINEDNDQENFNYQFSMSDKIIWLKFMFSFHPTIILAILNFWTLPSFPKL
jgi:hypothetical protein